MITFTDFFLTLAEKFISLYNLYIHTELFKEIIYSN